MILPETTREYTVSRLTDSDRGVYSCRGEKGPNHKTLWSSTTSVIVLSENTAPTDSGSYSCRGVLDHTVTQWSRPLTTSRPKVIYISLTLDPNWPEVFVGETLTLRCEVEGSGDGWTYDWRRNNELLTETTRETLSHIGAAQPLSIADTELQTGGSVTLSCSVSPSSSGWKYEWIRNKQLFTHGSSELRVSEGGEYQCRAFRGDPPYFTELSPSFRLTTTGVPRPLLSASVSWLSPGASVSLSCAVTAPSAGWSYHWYRAVPQSQGYRYELLPEASAGTTQDSFSVQDAEASVSLSVSPDRAQHFTGDVITLSCGFNSTDTDWRVQRLYQNNLSTQKCFNNWRTDKTKCDNALNISVHSDIILMSPVRPVTEGQTVSLGCKLKTVTSSVLLFSFYKNGKVVQNGTKAEFNISAVSRSDEGFYKCEAQELKKQQRSAPKTWTSLESWMSVRSE
uniref:Ig-like domain-containing protein n=1 Tax=Neogobius melanostomus TaxID=47308 RepID=A0A8C6V7C4_9GOBI